jgi:hypothetical protein
MQGADQVLRLAFLEEAEEALEVFAVEGVVDIFFEVEAQLAFGEMQLPGGFGANFGDFVEAEIAGGEEVGGQLGRDDFRARGPDGEDRRLFGEVPPFFDHIVDVEVADAGNPRGGAGGQPFGVGAGSHSVFGGDGDAQGGVADDERGIRAGEHGGGVGIALEKFRCDLPAAGGEDSDQRLRAAGAAVERDAARPPYGNFAEQQEAAHAFLGGDGETRENGEGGALADDALVFDGGNDGHVGGAGAQGFGALRRDGEGEVVFALQGAVGEAADQRGGVEILHYGDTESVHGDRVRVKSKSPLRKAGSTTAPLQLPYYYSRRDFAAREADLL